MLGRRELSQVRVVERFQVQQSLQALGGKAFKNIFAHVTVKYRKNKISEKCLIYMYMYIMIFTDRQYYNIIVYC